MNFQVKSGDLPPFKPLPQKPPSIEVDPEAGRHDLYPIALSAGGNAPLHRPSAGGEGGRAPRAQLHRRARRLCPAASSATGASSPMARRTRAHRPSRSALLDRGLGPDTPVMVLSGNSIAHAVMMLGAMKARVPVAPVSVAYSLMSRRSRQAAPCLRDGEAEDDLRRAGPDLCARARGACRSMAWRS